MSDVLIRGVNQATLERLRARAKRHQRSLQAEIRTILDDVATRDEQREEAIRVAHSIKERLRAIPQSDSTDLIRADRDR